MALMVVVLQNTKENRISVKAGGYNPVRTIILKTLLELKLCDHESCCRITLRNRVSLKIECCNRVTIIRHTKIQTFCNYGIVFLQNTRENAMGQ